MIAFRWIFFAISALSLSGCAAAIQKERMTNNLNQYVGQSVANFVAMRGEPESSVKLGEGQNAFRWVLTGTGAGGVVPIGGSLIVVPPRQLTCTVTLTATTSAKVPEYKDWIVTGWNWQGAC